GRAVRACPRGAAAAAFSVPAGHPVDRFVESGTSGGEEAPSGLAAVENSDLFPHMANLLPSNFHLHLISDATGETLTTMAKAAAVQYAQVRPIEHVHPLVRTAKQLERVLKEVEQSPGIVLYTIVKKE